MTQNGRSLLCENELGIQCDCLRHHTWNYLIAVLLIYSKDRYYIPIYIVRLTLTFLPLVKRDMLPIQASPAVGTSSPVSILKVLVLPAPLTPRTPKHSPRPTRKLILLTAGLLAPINILVRPLTIKLVSRGGSSGTPPNRLFTKSTSAKTSSSRETSALKKVVFFLHSPSNITLEKKMFLGYAPLHTVDGNSYVISDRVMVRIKYYTKCLHTGKRYHQTLEDNLCLIASLRRCEIGTNKNEQFLINMSYLAIW